MYLEIATNDEKIYAIPAVNLAGLLDRGVDGMERAMTLDNQVRFGTIESINGPTQPSTAIRMLLGSDMVV